MKIVCEKCNARYSLSDEKIRNIGRTRFGVRCKTCGNLIRVAVIEAPIEPTPEELRGFTPAPPPPKEKSGVDIFSDADLEGEFGKAFGGQATGQSAAALESAARVSASPTPRGDAGAGAAKKKREDTKLYDYREFQALLKKKGLLNASPKPETPQEPEVEWFLALDGNQKGPFARKAAEAEVAANADLAENGFAWRDGLADWLPVVDIPELREAARKAISSRGAPPPLAAIPPAERPPVAPVEPVSQPALSVKPAEPVAAPLPASPAPSASLFPEASPSTGTDVPKPRNEESVLFSLDALKTSTFAAKEEPAPAPASERPEATGLRLEVRDTPVLPQASGLKPHVSSAPAPAPAPAPALAPRAIATPIQIAPPAMASRTKPKRSNALFIGLGIAVVAGGGAAIAFFAMQEGPAKPAPTAQPAPPPDTRRTGDESSARAAGAERGTADPQETAPTAAANPHAGRVDERADARVVAGDAARLPLPEGTTPTAQPTLAGAPVVAAQPGTAQPTDVRAPEAPRPTAASAAPDNDDPRDHRRRRGKRRRGRETVRTTAHAVSASRRTKAAAAQPTPERLETAARAATPPASAARGDAVLDDILGGGTSSPPARVETPRPTARRADARRTEARAPSPVRREDPPPPRQDPPREVARPTVDTSLPRTLNGSDIKSRVERNRHRVNLCYSSTVTDKSEKKGRLVVSFVIERNGRPSHVGVDRAGYWGSEMSSCVTTAFSKLRFGAFTGDPIEVRFPFVLGDF